MEPVLYLIGGPGRVGKTTTASLLASQLRAPHVPAEAVISMMARTVPDIGVSHRMPAEEKAELFAPHLIALSVGLCSFHDAVLEGPVVVPELIETIACNDEVLEHGTSVRACMMGASGITAETILRHEGANTWFSRLPESEHDEMALAIRRESHDFRRRAEACGVPFVDMSEGSFETQQSKVIALLMDNS